MCVCVGGGVVRLRKASLNVVGTALWMQRTHIFYELFDSFEVGVTNAARAIQNEHDIRSMGTLTS